LVIDGYTYAYGEALAFMSSPPNSYLLENACILQSEVFPSRIGLSLLHFTYISSKQLNLFLSSLPVPDNFLAVI
jgi:hypothetical protein